MTSPKWDAIESVQGAAFVRSVADKYLAAAVGSARAAGASWREIADAIGVTRREAKRRFKDSDLVVFVNEPKLVKLEVVARIMPEPSSRSGIDRLMEAGLLIPARNLKRVQRRPARLTAAEARAILDETPTTDTTEYLLSSPANREHIMRSMGHASGGEGEQHDLVDPANRPPHSEDDA